MGRKRPRGDGGACIGVRLGGMRRSLCQDRAVDPEKARIRRPGAGGDRNGIPLSGTRRERGALPHV